MARFFKHFIPCMLIIAAALCYSAFAFAAGIDISQLTDDEIVELLAQVNEAMAERNIQKTATLPQGEYIVGRDIPAGSYVYTCLAKGDDWGSVTVYSEGGAGDQLLWEIVGAPEEGEDPDQIFLTVNDGDQLKSGVPFSLTISKGVIFK